MKTLIAYYTQTGKNKEIAELLQARLSADLEEIKEEKKTEAKGMGMAIAAFKAVLKKKEKIKKTEKNAGDYDLVIVATPVWAANLPPATRAYLEENKGKIKKIALASVSGKGTENKGLQKLFEDTAGRKTEAALILSEKEEKLGKLEKFAKELKG